MLTKITPQNVARAALIERLSLPAPWGEELLTEALDNPLMHLYCTLTEAGQMSGFFVMGIYYETAHLMTVAVDPDYRRQGIGTELVRGAEQIARANAAEQILLEARTNNDAAISLYKKRGYNALGVRKAFYSNGDDALVMQLLLSN